MKRVICILVAAMMLISLAACSGSSDKSGSSSSAASSAANKDSQKPTEAVSAETGTAETGSAGANTSGTKNGQSKERGSDGVDVDLTSMSSTMVYSEVQNMMKHPDEYTGKVVKMKGPFNVTEIEDKRYYACIIKDATACCSTGIEFEWAGDHTYPDDYPKKDQEITVTGTFNVYTEGKGKYMQLKDSQVEF